MADEKDLELAKAKAAAAAKAKAAAAAKAKAAAAAKAKTAAAVKEKEADPANAVADQAQETNGAPQGGNRTQAEEATAQPGDPNADTDAKEKAAAAAKAKAAAAAKAKAAAAAKAKTSAAVTGNAAATGKKTAGTVPQGEEVSGETEAEKPSKNRPILDVIVKRITETVGEGVIEQAGINFRSNELPTLTIRSEKWLEVAKVLRDDPQLSFDYLSDVHGIDFETHMEVYYFLQSFSYGYQAAFHVKTKRDGGTVPSVTALWPGADWQEREIYDLFGISFDGHPNMTRILLPDHWVGYPLRKDYEPYDEEV